MRRFKRLQQLLFCSGLLATTQPVGAEPMFGGHLGYSRATLTRNQPETMSGFSAQAHLGYDYLQYGGYGFFQTNDISYIHNGESYKGAYTLYGLGLRYSAFPSMTRRLTVAIQKPVAASMTTLTETKGTVKGSTYLYSSLTTLTGTNAMQALIGYEYLRQGRGGTRRGENLYFGLYLAFLKQTFAKQVTRIRTNNSVLQPIAPGTESVSYSFTMTTIYFSVDYDL